MRSESLSVLLVLISSVGICLCQDSASSHCPDTSCTPAPPGASCEPKYERDDLCCPVWYCSNGQTVYGMSKSSSGSSSFHSSSFNGFGGGGVPPQMPVFSFNLPFFGRR